jgi:ribosomal protein L32
MNEKELKCPQKKCNGKMIYLEAEGKAPAEYVCKNCGYRILAHYYCAVCGCALGLKRSEVHNHYLDELVALVSKNEYVAITEGGMPQYRKKREWGKPDVFLLRKGRLEKIIEVSVGDKHEGSSHRTIESKCRKIKDYYNPPELIIFEPTRFTTLYYSAESETGGNLTTMMITMLISRTNGDSKGWLFHFGTNQNSKNW